MDETKLYQECAEKYKALEKLYWDKTSCGFVETIKKMFKLVNGHTTRMLTSERAIEYDGIVDNSYTVGGTMLMGYEDGKFYCLIEDLTMAYYSTNGGTEFHYTPDFIKFLKKNYM